ncbi:hypothetical protein D3C75_1142610 [compost metagenome]
MEERLLMLNLIVMTTLIVAMSITMIIAIMLVMTVSHTHMNMVSMLDIAIVMAKMMDTAIVTIMVKTAFVR